MESFTAVFYMYSKFHPCSSSFIGAQLIEVKKKHVFRNTLYLEFFHYVFQKARHLEQKFLKRILRHFILGILFYQGAVQIWSHTFFDNFHPPPHPHTFYDFFYSDPHTFWEFSNPPPSQVWDHIWMAPYTYLGCMSYLKSPNILIGV